MGWARIECSVVDLSIRDHGLHIAAGVGVDVLASVLAVAQGSGAISAIVEDGYHDPDYRHEYWRHYSRVFAPPVAVTKRIHFFAEPAKELVDLNDDELVLRGRS